MCRIKLGEMGVKHQTAVQMNEMTEFDWRVWAFDCKTKRWTVRVRAKWRKWRKKRAKHPPLRKHVANAFGHGGREWNSGWKPSLTKSRNKRAGRHFVWVFRGQIKAKKEKTKGRKVKGLRSDEQQLDMRKWANKNDQFYNFCQRKRESRSGSNLNQVNGTSNKEKVKKEKRLKERVFANECDWGLIAGVVVGCCWLHCFKQL